MFKKSISLILVLIMAISMAVPAYAGNDAEILNEQQAYAAAEAGVAALVAEEGEEVTVDKDLADKIVEDAKTPEAISKSISKFVFIEKSKVGELSDAIVADSKYTVKVTADGKDTVYIAVNLIEHPEIYDARVFINVVKKLEEKSNDFAVACGIDINSDNYAPLLYTNIAGELSLHMIIYTLTDAIDGENWTGFIGDLYDRSSIADLNIDENRIPRQFIEFIGMVLTFLLGTLFG